jgi:virulence-associated protein VagC
MRKTNVTKNGKRVTVMEKDNMVILTPQYKIGSTWVMMNYQYVVSTEEMTFEAALATIYTAMK